MTRTIFPVGGANVRNLGPGDVIFTKEVGSALCGLGARKSRLEDS